MTDVDVRRTDTDGIYYLCGWSLSHCGKHRCSCACVMPQGHDTKCKCELEYP